MISSVSEKLVRALFYSFPVFLFSFPVFLSFPSTMPSLSSAVSALETAWLARRSRLAPIVPSLIVPYDGFHYHPHQEEGVRWMIAREAEGALYLRGGILADEMGLGKTWETMGLLVNRPVPNTLILVPPILLAQWSKVLEKSRMSYSVLCPGAKWKRNYGIREGVHVYLATYDRMVRNLNSLEGKPVDRILADEGHALRNQGTRRFQALRRLEAPRRWILSGTPVQNKLDDFKALCAWLSLARQPEISWAEYAKDLILRRVVADVQETVADFPENKPNHHIVPVTMPEGGDEKLVFDTLVRRFQSALDLQAASIQVLELYLRIRQFLAHPQIYIDAMHRKFKGDYRRARAWTATASKMQTFQRLLRETPKRPTIVFTNFQDEMEYAEGILQTESFRTFKVCGGQTDIVRASVIQQSEESVAKGEPTAILIQIVAGNAGLNLQHMNRIIFLSSHWNPAVVDQAVARAYRIGQTNQVDVYHILLADGAEKNLDRYIAKCHTRKRTAAQQLHQKLVCEAAVDSEQIIKELNLICPEECEATEVVMATTVYQQDESVNEDPTEIQ